MTRRTRLLLSSLLLLTVFVGVPVLLTWRAVRQEKLNRALIAAVKQRKADAVVSLLKQGADPNAREHNAGPASAWQVFLNLILLHPQNKTARRGDDTALTLAVNAWPTGEAPKFIVDPNIVYALLDAGANPK